MLVDLQALSEDVLARYHGPRAGMWTYVAAIAAHAASNEIAKRGENDVLAVLRF